MPFFFFVKGISTKWTKQNLNWAHSLIPLHYLYLEITKYEFVRISHLLCLVIFHFFLFCYSNLLTFLYLHIEKFKNFLQACQQVWLIYSFWYSCLTINIDSQILFLLAGGRKINNIKLSNQKSFASIHWQENLFKKIQKAATKCWKT